MSSNELGLALENQTTAKTWLENFERLSSWNENFQRKQNLTAKSTKFK